MGTLSISEETLRELSALADAEEVPLEVETERLLRLAIEQRRERLALVEELRRIAAMTPEGVVQTDSVVLIREDRDR